MADNHQGAHGWQRPTPSYWAVLPALIRYDDQICANAKLLYAEISSLINRAGFCWADNGYFARLYQVSERSVRAWLEQLEDAGYIKICEKHGQRNAVQWRRIYAAVNPMTGAKEPVSSLEENFRSLEENFQTNNYITNSTNKKCPARSPKCLPERFEAFWKFYHSIPGEGGQPRNEKRAEAVKAWDKLQPDDALVDRIAAALQKQLRTADWRKGVGIPMAATYLNQHRWEDAEELPDLSEAQLSHFAKGAKIPWI